MTQILEQWQKLVELKLNFIASNSLLQAIVVIAASWLVALIVDRILVVWIKRLARLSTAKWDDRLIDYLHRPVFISVILMGFASAAVIMQPSVSLMASLSSLLLSLAILVWAQFLLRAARLLLRTVAQDPVRFPVLHPKTLPLFENIIATIIIALAVYYILSSWRIDMTAWLASAGIIGIAVGFAAKDTLANLFSGVFILADAPYKIGDFVILDGGERGEITKIGIRSTRMLTRDDIEITVPNSVIGNSKIINESGGPHEKFRIRVEVGVAYGSDIGQIRNILQQIGEQEEQTCSEPEPRVRFRKFGASSLDFELLCWIDKPVLRGRVVDRLNTAIYNAFQREGIEIPYSKHDVYIKSMPESPAQV